MLQIDKQSAYDVGPDAVDELQCRQLHPPEPAINVKVDPVVYVYSLDDSKLDEHLRSKDILNGIIGLYRVY